MECLPKRKFYIDLRAENIDFEKAIKHCLDNSNLGYIEMKDSDCIHIYADADYPDELNNVTHLFLKQPEYTLDNLPEKWFVEYSDDIDEELLAIKLGGGIGGQYKYYGVGKIYYCCNDLKSFYDHTNVTHLFLKKKEEEKIEIIEIDGKKYRQVAIDYRLEVGDLFLAFNEVFKYIGLDEDSVIAKNSKFKYVDTGIALGEIKFKLEEIKTKTWHYAILKCSFGQISTSLFRESKEDLKEACPDAIEYRTFTEEI